MNELANLNNSTINSREIAKMIGINHWEILRKLEGSKDGKSKGIIQTLTDNNFVVSDYFIKSLYKDESGKENICYEFTKLGCEFIANKFTGEKGILFTAAYVKRFNEMESYIKNNKMLNVLSAEMTTLVDTLVARKIDEIEEKCSKYYRPVSKEKQNIVTYIKKRLGIDKADADYELVKQRVLIKLNADKWEDIPVQTLVNSLNIIDQSIRVIKADRNISQVSLFD